MIGIQHDFEMGAEMRRRGRRIFGIGIVTGGFCVAGMTGCATQDQGTGQMSSAMQRAWPAIMEDAMLGVEARTDPVFMARHGESSIDEGVAESRRERIQQFGAAISRTK